MSSEISTYLAIVAIVIGLIGYIPYMRDIVRGKTRPHAFTWLIWGVLTGIAFFAQLSDGGGAGAWVSGATAIISLIFAGVGWRVARQDIKAVDWAFLAVAALAILLWLLTTNPLWSVLLITFADAIAFLPTIRKSYLKPWQETVETYAFSAVKFAIALFALEAFTLTTALYPISLVVMNGLFVVMVLTRRAQLKSER